MIYHPIIGQSSLHIAIPRLFRPHRFDLFHPSSGWSGYCLCAGIYWNKTKKKVVKSLHLEEQENEWEEDLKVFDPEKEETP